MGNSTSKAENGMLKKEKAALLEKIAELEGKGGGQAPSKGKKKKQKQPSAEEGEQVFASFHDDGKDGLILALKKETAEQKAALLTFEAQGDKHTFGSFDADGKAALLKKIVLLESKLATKEAGIVVLFDGK
jgi:hypothetical protein